MSLLRSLRIFIVVLAACDGGSDDDVRFNADDQATIEVGGELGDDVIVDLHSTTGTVVIGSATVSPGSGPVGTVHTVTIAVDDEYEDDVSRVVVHTDAGERGVEDVTLLQDSADHGLWWREITSVGTEDETRTDTFTFQLFTPADATTDDSDAAQ